MDGRQPSSAIAGHCFCPMERACISICSGSRRCGCCMRGKARRTWFYVAHAALVQHGVAAVSSFTHPQRQTEEQHLKRWFQDAGFLLWETPRETSFEGEGDALFDAQGGHLWAAHGVRTCRHSHRHVADAWQTPVTSLHLVDPRFLPFGSVLCAAERRAPSFTFPRPSMRRRWRRSRPSMGRRTVLLSASWKPRSLPAISLTLERIS
jgi:hypothetical protein